MIKFCKSLSVTLKVYLQGLCLPIVLKYVPTLGSQQHVQVARSLVN